MYVDVLSIRNKIITANGEFVILQNLCFKTQSPTSAEDHELLWRYTLNKLSVSTTGLAADIRLGDIPNKSRDAQKIASKHLEGLSALRLILTLEEYCWRLSTIS
jgi:hypothetical protein